MGSLCQRSKMAAALRRSLPTIPLLSGLRRSISHPQHRIKVVSSSSIRFYSDKIVDPPYLGPVTPNYRTRVDETVETKRSRLLYQSRKRGMLENGLLLSTFADKYLRDFDKGSLEHYDKLINQPTNDWDLYYWMIGNQPTPEEYDNDVMDLMKDHAKNEQRHERLRQPDLKEPLA